MIPTSYASKRITVSSPSALRNLRQAAGGRRSLRGLQSSSQTVPYGIDMVGARDVWDANCDGIVDLGAPTGANRKI